MILTATAGVVAVVWSVVSILLFSVGPQVNVIYVAIRSYGAIAGVFAITRVVGGDLRRLTAATALLLGCVLSCDCFTVFLAAVAFFALRNKAARQFIASQGGKDSSLRAERQEVARAES